jgi:hypothetical protein
MTTDNFCFYLQNRLIQTSQTGGQLYSDTSPFSIPCCLYIWLHLSLCACYNLYVQCNQIETWLEGLLSLKTGMKSNLNLLMTHLSKQRHRAELEELKGPPAQTEGRFVEQNLMLSSSLRSKLLYVTEMILITLCYAIEVKLGCSTNPQELQGTPSINLRPVC